MIYIVYILKNLKNRRYIGQTNKLNERLLEHNANKSEYTKNRGPWGLIFKKDFATRKEAIVFEKLLKKQKGGNGLKKIIGDF
jgi:putative endonuclease